MRRILPILSAAIIALFLVTPASAESKAQQQKGVSQQQQQVKQQKQAEKQNLISSDWLVGKEVYSAKDEELGQISNLILDERTGNIGYVVISSDEFFEMSEEKHTVPYRALTINRDRVTLNMDKQKLEQAPGYKEGVTMEDFNRESSEFFGISPVWGEHDFDWYDTEVELNENRRIEDVGK